MNRMTTIEANIRIEQIKMELHEVKNEEETNPSTIVLTNEESMLGHEIRETTSMARMSNPSFQLKDESSLRSMDKKNLLIYSMSLSSIHGTHEEQRKKLEDEIKKLREEMKEERKKHEEERQRLVNGHQEAILKITTSLISAIQAQPPNIAISDILSPIMTVGPNPPKAAQSQSNVTNPTLNSQ